MTEDPQDQGYLDLFKPKANIPAEGADQAAEPGAGDLDPSARGEPLPPEESDHMSPPRGAEPRGAEEILSEPLPGANADFRFAPFARFADDSGRTLRIAGAVIGGGCLLLMLTAVVVFAFVQVFLRRDSDKVVKTVPPPTKVVAVSPTPTIAAVRSPVIVPLVSSNDVRVPVTLPARLTVDDTGFTVQAVAARAEGWPDPPADGSTVNWAYGTVVNYILVLAPTPENLALVSTLDPNNSLRLHMSTGLVLSFNVDEVITGSTDESSFFEQSRPKLTLAVLAAEPVQRTVVTASFLGEEADSPEFFSEAAIGLVGTQVQKGPVRVTLLETYQVSAAEAGLPAGTSYYLVDLRVENVAESVLQPDSFQTFVSDAAGNRFPLTLPAEQFTHYGIPVEALAPGETVIGSVGYLMPDSAAGQARWVFNPLPGSDHWVVVPITFEPPPSPPTAAPPAPVGIARVTVDTDDVFVNRDDNLLDISLRIENVSQGVVRVTESDVRLSSWTDGELSLVAPAPPLPWVIDPGELQLFQLQFERGTADAVLLSVLGYTFSIENLGGE